MDYTWVIEHTNGDVTAKRDNKGVLHPYHLRGDISSVPNKEIRTIGLQDEMGKPVVVVDVPKGAYVFQRHRTVPINYTGRTHEATQTIPSYVSNGRFYAEKTVTKTYPEATYDDVWIVGYRKRKKDGSVTIFFKTVYPDGKIDEHHAWNEKPWLFEPEWFIEEQV
jgi:hypothetical protein